MKKKPIKRKNVLFAAVMWTIASGAWIFALVMNMGRGNEGLVVLQTLTAGLSVVNSVICWIRYVQFEDENEK